jgi:hypothetical protein
MRQESIQADTEHYVFRQSIERVWLAAMNLLIEEGFTPIDADTGHYRIETTWKFEQNIKTRYLAEAVRTSNNQCTLRFTRDSGMISGTYTEPQRDWELELKLIERLEPDRAAEIEERAKEKAEGSGA